jgi:hypothetical protein
MSPDPSCYGSIVGRTKSNIGSQRGISTCVATARSCRVADQERGYAVNHHRTDLRLDLLAASHAGFAAWTTPPHVISISVAETRLAIREMNSDDGSLVLACHSPYGHLWTV